MPTPKLGKIIELLETGEPFTLTNSQYKAKTGLDIPKSPYYLLTDSAVAKRARAYGYKLAVREREIVFEKED